MPKCKCNCGCQNNVREIDFELKLAVLSADPNADTQRLYFCENCKKGQHENTISSMSKRRSFPDHIVEAVLKKQNHKCARCDRILNVVDIHHLDGNRANNDISNCQALCPNCHAIITRS